MYIPKIQNPNKTIKINKKMNNHKPFIVLAVSWQINLSIFKKLFIGNGHDPIVDSIIFSINNSNYI